MFTCTACLRRAFDVFPQRNLPGNLRTSCSRPPPSPSPSPSSSPFQAASKSSRLRRSYATVVARAPPANPTPHALVAPRRDKRRRTEHGQNSQNRASAPMLGRETEWAARKELEYLGDALLIAKRVKTALAKDNFDLAITIARQASKRNNVVVTWNHLIEYQLQNQRMHAALKLYSEMKKRAQQPNAQTFTIIFRGCARSEHPKLAVSEAIKLYQNMVSLGRIKPNTIHLNAVLQVCARAGDLDSMFSILSSSDDPLRSPNNLTYTTILNAMRTRVEREIEPADDNAPKRLSEEQVHHEVRITIQRARTVWEEVIARWRSGSIIIDEELVCAMGRILLMGGYKDIDTIESLIEQTMMISRAKNKGLPGEAAPTPVPALAPAPQSAIKAPGAPAVNHALPGNNSLSMILEALEKTRRTTKAVKYWNLFTLHYHVLPDAENWFRALRVFHTGKNSGRASTALQAMPTDMIARKHVRIAMKTCLRDNLNKAALDNATAILKTMGKVPSIPDVQSLRTYLQVAHATKRSHGKLPRHGSTDAIDPWAKSLAAALDHLFGPYQTVAKKYLTDSPETNDPHALEKLHNLKLEVIALARKIVAAYDILTNENLASLDAIQARKIRSRHAGITRIITNYYKDVEPRLVQEQLDMADSEVIRQQEDAEDYDFQQRDHRGQSRTAWHY
ncbi:hypothetical protein F4777DRAFT_315376 [Nemania sp. FL0916]|nr:hypothetical protein F4777DRAFT_315376 [Nemania sp. FL0916]